MGVTVGERNLAQAAARSKKIASSMAAEVAYNMLCAQLGIAPKPVPGPAGKAQPTVVSSCGAGNAAASEGQASFGGPGLNAEPLGPGVVSWEQREAAAQEQWAREAAAREAAGRERLRSLLPPADL